MPASDLKGCLPAAAAPEPGVGDRAQSGPGGGGRALPHRGPPPPQTRGPPPTVLRTPGVRMGVTACSGGGGALSCLEDPSPDRGTTPNQGTTPQTRGPPPAVLWTPGIWMEVTGCSKGCFPDPRKPPQTRDHCPTRGSPPPPPPAGHYPLSSRHPLSRWGSLPVLVGGLSRQEDHPPD